MICRALPDLLQLNPFNGLAEGDEAATIDGEFQNIWPLILVGL